MTSPSVATSEPRWLLEFASDREALTYAQGWLYQKNGPSSSSRADREPSSPLLPLQSIVASLWQRLCEWIGAGQRGEYLLGVRRESERKPRLVLVDRQTNSCVQRCIKALFNRGFLKDLDLDVVAIAKHLESAWDEENFCKPEDEEARREVAKIATRALAKGYSGLWQRSPFLLTDLDYVAASFPQDGPVPPLLQQIVREEMRAIDSHPLGEREALFSLWRNAEEDLFLRDAWILHRKQILPVLKEVLPECRKKVLECALKLLGRSTGARIPEEWRSLFLQLNLAAQKGRMDALTDLLDDLNQATFLSVGQCASLIACFCSLSSEAPRKNLERLLRSSHGLASFLNLQLPQQQSILGFPPKFFEHPNDIESLLSRVPSFSPERIDALLPQAQQLAGEGASAGELMDILKALHDLSKEQYQRVFPALTGPGSHCMRGEAARFITLLDALPPNRDLGKLVGRYSRLSRGQSNLHEHFSEVVEFLELFPEEQLFESNLKTYDLFFVWRENETLRGLFQRRNSPEGRLEMARICLFLAEQSPLCWVVSSVGRLEEVAGMACAEVRGLFDCSKGLFYDSSILSIKEIETFLSLLVCLAEKRDPPLSVEERRQLLACAVRSVASDDESRDKVVAILQGYLKWPAEERLFMAEQHAKLPAPEQTLDFLTKLRQKKIDDRLTLDQRREEIGQTVGKLSSFFQTHIHDISSQFLQKIALGSLGEFEALLVDLKRVVKGEWSGLALAHVSTLLLGIEEGEREMLNSFIRDCGWADLADEPREQILGYISSLSKEKRSLVLRTFFLLRTVRYTPPQRGKKYFPFKDLREAVDKVLFSDHDQLCKEYPEWGNFASRLIQNLPAEFLEGKFEQLDSPSQFSPLEDFASLEQVRPCLSEEGKKRVHDWQGKGVSSAQVPDF